jgi:hypothetical protein
VIALALRGVASAVALCKVQAADDLAALPALARS